MKLLTFREAAEIGRCSATSIDRAVKAGDLKVHRRGLKKGFDPDEVRDWALRRWTPMEIAVALERINILWAQTTALMAVELMILDRQKVPFEEQADPVMQCIRAFLVSFDQMPDDKFTYAEGVYFPQLSEGGLKLPRDLDPPNDLGTRAEYALFTFVRYGVSFFVEAMVRRGVLVKDDEDKWIASPDLHLDSFASFQELARMAEKMLAEMKKAGA